MNLPKVLTELVKAQDNFDSTSYANCFAETAVVVDEGKTYNGKNEIKSWIEKANKEYQVTMKPLEYSETTEILTAEVSGNFPGSSVILSYNLNFKNELIQSMRITS
ncbi:nuclear transport factor 2 family protein [Flagellimonas iocasae]|uniref:Nuclear transport factor 2 family protein n=1 Tax=Flagellimonas iocasae TaxID=2055905 RepID=A0ABW4Y3D7_9FLAO